MTARYFVEQPIDSNKVVLATTEAHHLLHVMRGKPGDEVTLFDGGGDQFQARVMECGRREVWLEVIDRQTIDREARVAITVAAALPKGDRQQWLVEKLVELGANEMIPLRTERSVAEPSDKATERLRRGVIEASKQCGRNRLMRIAEPMDWQALIEATDRDSLRLVAHPGSPLPHVKTLGAVKRCSIAVGPEGGLTNDEVQLASAQGWLPVSLGPRILRVETAAVALTAWLGLSLLGEL